MESITVSGLVGSLFSGGAFIAAIAYAFSVWKNSKGQADADTIKTYESEMKIVKDKLTRIENDNKTLIGQINKLEGENKALRELLTYQDPDFRVVMKNMADALKCMSDDFRAHYQDDAEKFNKILSYQVTIDKKLDGKVKAGA